MRHVQIGDVTLHFELRPGRDRPDDRLRQLARLGFPHLGRCRRGGAARGLRRLRYDLRGHGLSDLGKAPELIDDHARDLAALMDAMGVERAPICGVSVGGAIALGLYRRLPHRATRLILNNTGAKIGTAESWNARIAAVETGGVEAVAEAVLQRWFPAAEYRQGGGAVALCRNMLSRTPSAGYIATCVALRDSDMTEAARRSRFPRFASGANSTAPRRRKWCAPSPRSRRAPAMSKFRARATCPACSAPRRSRARS